MGVVKSLHDCSLNANKIIVADKKSLDINALVTNITFDILREDPQTVAEVENGNMEKAVLEKAVIQSLDKQKFQVGLSRDEVIEQVFNYMFGYGILHELIENDDDISDIDFTQYNQGTIKKNGRRYELDISFGNEKLLETYCKLIAIRNGGILNENDTHCRVADEKRRLRINVSIRPRNISGPAISIRKHRKDSYTLNDLVRLEMINEEIAEFTYRIARSDASPVLCGKGGSGKSTLARAIINNMPELDRILVTESDSELYPDKPNCIVQRIKKLNEGGVKVTLRDLVKDGLTMSLDTYFIGEVVGDESWEFIKAGFTGHRVGTTIHTWSSADVFPRLLTLAKGAGTTESEKIIKEMMAKSIDIIYHMKGFKVVDICEVLGYDSTQDKFLLNQLFKFDIRDEYEDELITGKFVKCGDIGERLINKFGRKC